MPDNRLQRTTLPAAAEPGVRRRGLALSEKSVVIRKIRAWLGIFIGGLVVSGLTAFPLERELALLTNILGISSVPPSGPEPALHTWLRHVHHGVSETNRVYPFIAYGTDWLAFGHLVIALAFVGAFRDPVRNKWLISFGLISCAAVIPMAIVAGHFRGIPLAWRLIDCSFGVFGAIPLLVCRRYIRRLESESHAADAHV